MKNDITLRLTCQRRALGLNMTELAELPVVEQSNKVIADYESGRRKPAQSYLDAMRMLTSNYDFLLKLLLREIDAYYFKYPLPLTNNTDDYIERMQSVDHLMLPYYKSFDLFVHRTGHSNKAYWRIWQAVVGHLALTAKVLCINDNVAIPESLTETRKWLNIN